MWPASDYGLVKPVWRPSRSTSAALDDRVVVEAPASVGSGASPQARWGIRHLWTWGPLPVASSRLTHHGAGRSPPRYSGKKKKKTGWVGRKCLPRPVWSNRLGGNSPPPMELSPSIRMTCIWKRTLRTVCYYHNLKGGEQLTHSSWPLEDVKTNFEQVIFNFLFMIDILHISSYGNALRWMP